MRMSHYVLDEDDVPLVHIAQLSNANRQDHSDKPSTSNVSDSNTRTRLPANEKPGVIRWVSMANQPQLPVFEEASGILIDIDETSDELTCFSNFFGTDVIKNIKTETNQYAGTMIDNMKRAKKLKLNSMWQRWTTVKLQEIYYFFAVIIHMCLVRKPKITDYWSNDNIMHTPFPGRLLSRDRFRSILFMLHINDNATYVPRGQENHDPLHKVRPFFNHFVRQCKACLYPSENLTIDEGMCPFRGRLHFRVYIKNKPHKYGIKLYILCDTNTGYVLNCEVYTGGAGSVENSIESLVRRLFHDYFHKAHTIYMDRFYSSPTLFYKLKTLAVGTVQKNRKGLPPELKCKELARGEAIFRRCGPLLAVKWKDTRDVYCLSTKHKATCSEVTVRSRGGLVAKTKPDVVLDYNINKTGVDHVDQLLSYYPFQRKSMKCVVALGRGRPWPGLVAGHRSGPVFPGKLGEVGGVGAADDSGKDALQDPEA
ncbi:piggyBac transposable element-derived protein 4-like [Bacillus rossius redtenbacheri]|uniref:piggyBac transposable element-derived protein 4-like n=1 Tax=Bacillus rossius redtenbacheri TaxID=93214 RepID=UPI002FDD7617